MSDSSVVFHSYLRRRLASHFPHSWKARHTWSFWRPQGPVIVNFIPLWDKLLDGFGVCRDLYEIPVGIASVDRDKNIIQGCDRLKIILSRFSSYIVKSAHEKGWIYMYRWLVWCLSWRYAHPTHIINDFACPIAPATTYTLYLVWTTLRMLVILNSWWLPLHRTQGRIDLMLSGIYSVQLSYTVKISRLAMKQYHMS